MITLAVFGISILLAILSYVAKRIRLALSAVSALLMSLSVGYAAAGLPYVFGITLLIISVYQVFNILRLASDRLHTKHLKKAFFIGGTRLLALQAVAYLAGVATVSLGELKIFWELAVPVIHVVTSLVVFVIILRRSVLSKPKNIDKFLSDRELPSISVLIPARNEDDDLVELLKCVVANDYPKLEILVLDDCSANSRIPEIVKDFAHDGVRFIQGDMPKNDWLPKNQAYETLVNSSSGDWLIFMGVDVRLGTSSIRSLIHYAYNHQKSMVSVLPSRQDSAFWPGFFSPLRYFREMLKISLKKPNVPALSTAWLIKRDSYYALGGIESVARKVIPEHYFANKLSMAKQYAFVRTNSVLQISTAKNLKEQINTSLRVIYPGVHGRIEWTALGSASALLLLFAPFLLLVNYIITGDVLLSLVYAVTVVLLSASHLVIVIYTNPVLWPLAIVNLPYLILQEVVLGFVSMYRYEFGAVYWKQRNICLPAMQAIPHLPKIEDMKSNGTIN